MCKIIPCFPFVVLFFVLPLSLQIGLIFVFNLIVGTGALTLPSAFAKTGWLLGFVLIIVLAFISYITVTFVIEAMACANAISYWTRLQVLKRDCVSQPNTPPFFSGDRFPKKLFNFAIVPQPSINEQDSNTEDDIDATNPNDFVRDTCPSDDGMDSTIEHMPLFSQRSRYYMLDNKIELGEMARLFFNDTGRYLFFLCFAIYLYGDLSIYAAAVAKTMRDVIW